MNEEKLIELLLTTGIAFGASYFTYGLMERRKRQVEKSLKRASILDKYREHILTAAYQLQSRLYNIMRLNLINKAADQGGVYEHTLRHYTLYLLGQFFCWREIFRTEVHYLEIREGNEEIALLETLNRIEYLFATDRFSGALGHFMLFRGNQRIMGETMIRQNSFSQSFECMKYSEFLELWEAGKLQGVFAPAMDSLTAAIERPGEGFDRLRAIQHELIGLIDFLDPRKIRYREFRDKA
jgi:hypothetical protein